MLKSLRGALGVKYRFDVRSTFERSVKAGATDYPSIWRDTCANTSDVNCVDTHGILQ